jgi:protocatechuate 3,4-dioxygenase beta subunit
MLSLLLACSSPDKPETPNPRDSGPPTSDDSAPDSGSDTDDSAPPAESDPPDLNTPPTLEECGEAFASVDPEQPTAPAGFGPYWREDTPERNALNVAQEAGTRLILVMQAVNLDGTPLTNKRVTVWYAQQTLLYDTESPDASGYGWQRADANGTVCFSLIRPPNYKEVNGNYLPAHIHLAVGEDSLEASQDMATILYFTGDPYLTEQHLEEHRVTPEVIASGERIRRQLVLP